MGLFGSSSKKTSENINKSQGGQSSYGNVNNYNAEAGANLTVTDGGAVQAAVAMADKAAMEAQKNSAASAAVISRANDNNTALSGKMHDNNTALASQMNNNAVALSGEALRTNTNVIVSAGKYVGDLLAKESSENRQFVSEAHEANALLLGEMSKNNASLSGMAINANQQLATDALASSGAALNAMSVFANESLERVSDTNESALTQTNDAFKTSIQQLAANQAASQNQINDLLTNLQTEGESEVQKTSGKQTVWIVGIASVAVLAVALLARK